MLNLSRRTPNGQSLSPTTPARAVRLSPREIEILRWIGAGKSDWDIGQILHISAKTVNFHVERIKRKFAVATRVQAVLLAERSGLLQAEAAIAPRSGAPGHRSGTDGG